MGRTGYGPLQRDEDTEFLRHRPNTQPREEDFGRSATSHIPRHNDGASSLELPRDRLVRRGVDRRTGAP